MARGMRSGKAPAYFIPIVKDVLRRKRNGRQVKGIMSLVAYPMHALRNHQREELDNFLGLGATSPLHLLAVPVTSQQRRGYMTPAAVRIDVDPDHTGSKLGIL